MSDIEFGRVVDSISKYLEMPIIDYTNEIIWSRCPLCGDSTTNKKVRRFKIDFYPSYDTFVYHCFRCGESSNIVKLLSDLSNMDYITAKKKLLNQTFNTEYIKNKLSPTKKIVPKIKITEHTIFDDFIKNDCFSVNDKPEGRQDLRLIGRLKKFIKARQPTEKCYVCHSGKFKSRIIIPVLNEKGNIIYYQGRAVHDSVIPKYLNPKVEKDIILNFHNFKRDKYIIISEGILDALSVEYNQGTTILGAFLNDEFLKQLLKKTDKGIIIALDNYVFDDQSVKTIIKFKKRSLYYKSLKYFIFPHKYKVKDLNQLKTETDIENIYDFVVKNSYSSEIFWIKFNSIKW